MSQLLCEIDFSESVFTREDGQAPRINNVVLLGAESKNKRKYTTSCMERAVGLYEGCKAFVNHPGFDEVMSGARDMTMFAGTFKNPRLEEGKIRGDFFGIPGDPMTAKFMGVAEHTPKAAGLSHCAKGKVSKEGELEIVEEIETVFSVDLVSTPATTNGMFENHHKKKEQKMDYQEVSKVGLVENRSDLVDGFVAEGKASRDEEVRKLTEERDNAVTKLDELQVKEALAVKHTEIDKMLADSDLEAEAVTETFRNMLYRIAPKDGEDLATLVAEQIDDRAGAVKPGGVVHNGPRKQAKGGKIGLTEAAALLNG